MQKYTPTIGLEVHAHLKTNTKMFCANRNDPHESHPNVNVCPICLGHPGTLPTINTAAVEAVLRVGLALNCDIADETWFERKNYFYPDLPKGYQISQYERPLCTDGVFMGTRVRRIHLEEDAGRLLHADDGSSLVDYNRAGTPLMELVTEPDITTAEEARAFGEELQMVLRYLDVSDANMEQGQMRVEVNISLKSKVPPTHKATAGRQKSKAPEGLGTKVEIKNLNSFRAVEQAIAYEVERQSRLLDDGEEIVHATRGWDPDNQQTIAQRTKETSDDYRYFPEPDLPPFAISNMYDLESLRLALPELPQERRKRFKEEFGLQDNVLTMFVHNKALGELFEAVASELREWENATHEDPDAERHYPDLVQRSASVLATEVVGLIGSTADADIRNVRFTAENLAELVILLHDGAISSSAGDTVLEMMVKEGGDPSEIVKNENLAQVSDKEVLIDIIETVIDNNEEAVADYRSGDTNAIQFLVGQAMKESQGKADPGVARTMLEERLND